MKGRWVAIASAGALVAGLAGGATASAAFDLAGCSVPAFHYLFNGVAKAPAPTDIVAGDPNVIVCNGTSYVPIRYVARALGATVSWDQSTLTASINTGTAGSGSVPQSSSTTSASPTTGPWTSQGIVYSNAAVSQVGGTPSVDFQAQNTTSGAVAISFTVSFFDANGKLLGTATGADLNLPAGQTKTEQAAGFNPVTGWATITIQTDTEIPA